MPAPHSPPPTAPPTLPTWVAAEAANRFRARLGHSELAISVLEDGVLRFRWGAPGPERSWAVVASPPSARPPEAGTDAGAFVLHTAELSVRLQEDGALGVAQRGGPMLFEAPPGAYGEGPGEARRLRARIGDGERFYGFGEKTGSLDKRGCRLVLRNTDPFDDAVNGWRPGTDPMYVSIPFFLGLRGRTAYGLLTDNAHTLRFDLGDSDPTHWRVESAAGAIDQYLLGGPTLARILQRYAWLTGHLPMQPRWTLGYHQSRWGYYPDREVREICSELRSRDIPADGIWFDIQHLEGFRSFTWEREGFPDPEGLLRELDAIGFKTTVIIDPGLQVDEAWPVYTEGLREGHYLAPAGGAPYRTRVWADPAVFPDFTSPRTRRWWGGLVASYVRQGVRGAWVDMNEPATRVPEEGKTVPDALPIEGDGVPSTMAEGHNVYGHLMAQATREGLLAAAPRRRPFVLTRAGYAGIQRHAAVWTGDAPSRWQALRETLPMLLNLGLSGVPFVGSDVGGFGGDATAELYLRWLQLGALSPFFRVHCSKDGQRQEPWAFGPEVERLARDAVRERYRLLPYFYSLLREASRTGAPMLRPLIYEFQDDPQSAAIDDQAMLGPWLLVAPVLERGAATRSVYLPPGRWWDPAARVVRQGPARLEVPVSLASCPQFIREGAIVPRHEVLPWSDAAPARELELSLWPGAGAGSFELYEDEGDGFGFADGVFSAVRYAMQARPRGAVLTAGPRAGSFQPAERLLIARVPGVARVRSVRVDGTPLASTDDADALAATAPAWRLEPDGTLAVALPDRAGFSLEMDYDAG